MNGANNWGGAFSDCHEEAIQAEIVAQIQLLQDFGIEISHSDSYRHIHAALIIMLLVVESKGK